MGMQRKMKMIFYHMKRCSTLFIIEEIQIKTRWCADFTRQIGKNLSPIIASIGPGGPGLEKLVSITILVGVKIYPTLCLHL